MKKLIYIDYLRFISVLYIVGYWHLFNYTNAFPYYFNFITYNLSLVVLGLFVLLSGYLIGGTFKKNEFSVLGFYRKRLTRIYPLYLVATLVFYLYGINNEEITIKAAFVVSMLAKPAPLTLWFITMIVLFYILFPLLVRKVDNFNAYIINAGLIFSLFVLIELIFSSVDYKIFNYFPVFCIGIYFSQHKITIKKSSLVILALISVISIVLTLVKAKPQYLIVLNEMLVVSTGAFLIFYLSQMKDSLFKQNRFIEIVSYSSFAMYLFHRPIYSSLKGWYFPESGIYQILYLLLICLPVVIIFSLMIQKSYDYSISRLLKIPN